MANHTTNYNLIKPLGTENYDVENDNSNMDIIDAQLKTNADNISNLEEELNNINVPVKSVNEKIGDIVLKASDIKTDDGTTLEEVNSNFKSHLADNETEFSNLNARINNLNTNDLQARNEIVDIKLKLKEQSAIDFINKTGVGFYDTFADNSNIDPETTASYDSENKNVNFPSVEPYAVKATSDYNDVALINVDKVVGVGDKLNNTNPVTAVAPVDSVTYDRTTPVNVVGNTYNLSTTARPQVLSNGWIVTCAYDNTNIRLYFYVSKDKGVTWQQLCWIFSSGTSAFNFSICSYGTEVYIFVTYATNIACSFYKFDAVTVTNTYLIGTTVDSSQTSFGNGCSIAISSTGVLTAAWCSKNSTYSNTYNLRSAKSVNGGTTWIKQDGTSGIDQVTFSNATTTGYVNPYVQYDRNNSPIIFSSYDYSACKILAQIYSNGAWVEKTVYTAGSTSYTQAHPIATLQKYGINAGRIWVVWHGSDITDTNYFNIRVAYSDDNGATWSSEQKLTSGNTYEQAYPSITSDINGYVYILWYGVTSSSPSHAVIQQIIWNSTNWNTITTISSNTTNNTNSPVVCDNFYNFEKPIAIWIDAENTRIAFYGKWTVGTITYDITLTDPVTVSENEELLIYPIEKILKMKDEIFDTFNNLDLSLYPNKINKATIKGDVDNSTTVITGATDKTLTTGDKLFMDGVLNEVLNATGNYVTNTITDATVVNQAYDTSGNGGRKLVRLSNGWLVASCLYSSSQIKFYIDKRDGNGFIPSCTIYAGAVISSWAIQSKGNIIYGIHCTASSKGSVCTFNFDTTTIGTTTIDTSLTAYSIDSTQTNTEGGCSLVIDSTGNYLHAAWSSKNSSYPNSFNIRYAKGTINGDGSVTWENAVQVSKKNNSGMDLQNPSITIRSDGKPIVICDYHNSTTTYDIYRIIKDTTGSSDSEYDANWRWNRIYIGGSYVQSNPCAIFVPQSINGLANGRIWVTWYGLDATDTSRYNIRYSYSDDGGATWSAMTKLTTGNTVHMYDPSITANKNNEIFIVYTRTDNMQNIAVKYNGSTWDIVHTRTGLEASSNRSYPSTLVDLSLDFSIPLYIFRDGITPKVGFYGTWDVGEGYNLTMQNPATLTDGQQVPIVDFSVQQNNSDLELDSIDNEKFVFKGSNLNTTTASIEVTAKDNKLEAIAYAVA